MQVELLTKTRQTTGSAAQTARQHPTDRQKSESQHMAKWVYTFGDGQAEGSAAMRNLLGGKGANLAEMASLGLPVPPGFTITTEVCTWYYANNKSSPPDIATEVDRDQQRMGRIAEAPSGDAANPLLVSVRSGARASM